MKILARMSQPAQDRLSSIDWTAEKPFLEADCRLSTFRTALGWMGILGLDDELIAAYIGHSSAASIKASAEQYSSSIRKADWNPEARQMMEAYAEGDVIDFSEIPLCLPPMTPFRRLIVTATRRVPYGETTSYGELAQRIGHPGAARAVGTVMSTNRFPIFIPCHRVLAAGGNLGGYSCPAGIGLKRELLMMEASSIGKSWVEIRPK
jgi:methylated-DNA-[protein]-cysteine S-methyltransferase